MKFDKDINNQEILLDKHNDQTMMEWERPLMDAEVDMLQPKGHVLELGFGLGMSADAIQRYNPKSHTIIELEDDVFERAKLWASNKNNVDLIKGRWQDVMHKLPRQVYDETFFDVTETGGIKNHADAKLIEYWTYIFVDLWFHFHSKIGSKLTFFVADFNWPNTYNYQKLIAENPNWIHTYKMIDIEVPENCRYRNVNKAVVNLLERITIKTPTPKNIYRY
tara:strand:+ start:10472 stop:11134 length:663 start_codon:yes stop_codon:yes gene_type:complete